MDDRNAVLLEIKGLQYLVDRLMPVRKKLSGKADNERKTRLARYERLNAYKNEDELADAYGWTQITREEYERLLDKMQTGNEAAESTVTVTDIALSALSDCIRRLQGDISSLEYSVKSPEERQAIDAEHERLQARIAARRHRGGTNVWNGF